MRGILLDLDGTLIDDRGSTLAAPNAFLTAHGLDHTEGLTNAWRTI